MSASANASSRLSAQSGRATSLLLLGEAGIGKTALLDYAAGEAEERQLGVIRVRGVESDAELAFGGLLGVAGRCSRT